MNPVTKVIFEQKILVTDCNNLAYRKGKWNEFFLKTIILTKQFRFPRVLYGHMFPLPTLMEI